VVENFHPSRPVSVRVRLACARKITRWYELFMKRAVAVVFASIAYAALVPAAPAFAEPVLMDPQVPNGTGMWCQGGLGNVMLQPFCKGAPFADGTYWKQTGWIIPFQGVGWNPPACFGPNDQPAALGGCGGAV
jgi:hypothetical protein